MSVIRPDDIVRFLAYVSIPADDLENLFDFCWIWEGAVSYSVSTRKPAEYGNFTTCENGHRRWWKAHRYAYEVFRGPIPEGMTLDHDKRRCMTTLCVNPWHLEPVPNAVNVARMNAGRRRIA